MKQNYFIGVDISKSKIDCALISSDLAIILEKEVVNTDQKVKIFLLSVLKRLNLQPCELIVCCENTGIYNRPLERVCLALGVLLWVEHPLKIKRASTDMRGKNDRKDAIRIAQYTVRYQDKAVWYVEPSDAIKKLNTLQKVRETLLAQKVAIENQLREALSHDKQAYQILRKGFARTLKSMNESLDKVESDINKLAQQEDAIAKNMQLLQSIPGIGAQNAINLIITTNNFKHFSSAKHLACYAGVVPFDNQSGTIKKRERVSKMANLKIKKLLHLAAMTAIRHNKDLKAYYIRKVKEGKNKMSVLNAVRNKLVHRIFAVISRQTPFENSDTYQIGEIKTCILT